MTISNTTTRVVQATGNGSWTSIPVTYQFFTNIDGTHSIKVLKSPVDGSASATTLVENTDYTVTMADSNNPTTGSVEFSVAPTSSYYYTVIDNLSQTQSVDLQNGTIIDVSTIEAALDKLTILNQNIQTEKFERAIVLPEDTQVRNLTLNSLTGQHGKVLRIRNSEDGFDYVNIQETVTAAAFDISTLTTTTTVADSDKFPIYVVSGSTTKAITASNLANYIAPSVQAGVSLGLAVIAKNNNWSL